MPRAVTLPPPRGSGASIFLSLRAPPDESPHVFIVESARNKRRGLTTGHVLPISGRRPETSVQGCRSRGRKSYTSRRTMCRTASRWERPVACPRMYCRSWRGTPGLRRAGSVPPFVPTVALASEVPHLAAESDGAEAKGQPAEGGTPSMRGLPFGTPTYRKQTSMMQTLRM